MILAPDKIQRSPASPTSLERRPIPHLIWFRAVAIGLLVTGLLCAWLAWALFKQSDPYYGSFLLAISIAGIGGCIAVWGWENRMQKAAQRPTPWLDRRAWAKGEIAAAENATSTWGLGIIGTLAGGTAIVLFAYRTRWAVEPGLKWVALFLSLAFLGAAMYACRFRRKFGKSVLKLSTFPGVIGGTLEGTLRIGTCFPRNTAFVSQLQCLKQEYPALNEKGRWVGKVLWEDRQLVLGTSDKPGNSNIPLKFHIPATCPESADPLSGSNQIVWQLTVTASLPGLDYAANFEVPVYRRAA